MISVEKLVKNFGSRRAVDKVSFTVAGGEVLGFLGPNGAGKTTTMRMITGFLLPDSGTVTVDGHDVVRDPVSVKSKVGYLPEGAPSYPDMTVLDFLNFVADVRGLSGAQRTAAIDRSLDACHLGKVTRQIIGTLSKGFRQRVGFAQAILHDPPVLILDEPTDGLDPNQKHEVRNLIRNLAANKVVVLSTHILEEVEAVCTRAIILSDGKLVADDKPSNLVTKAIRHGLVTMRVKGDKLDGTLDALRKLDGIEQVEVLESSKSDPKDQPRSWTIYPTVGRNIRPELAKFVRDQGLEVHELTYERGRLDDVFRQITQSES